MIMKSVFLKFIFVCGICFIKPAGCISDYPPRVIGTTVSNHITTESWNNIEEEEGERKENLASGIRMKVYTGNSIAVATIADIPIVEPEIIYQYIDHAKPLVIYVHGFREHPSNESIQTVVGAHLERGTDNIFLFDWSELAFENYLKVIHRVKGISRILARVFDVFVDLGLDLERSHLVGHSLGAQIVGFSGKYSKNSIPRITGLDPAFPGFYHIGAEHIDAGSARFVDILHTDGGFYGALDDTGTVDFYANTGTRAQPGCKFLGVPLTPSDLCSHWRSWRYYAETVKNIFAFEATQCSSYLSFKKGKCETQRKVQFGYATPTDSHGSYYFKTRDKFPYGTGSNYGI